MKNKDISDKITEATETIETQLLEQSVSENRRAFIKKYGALAAITPVAITLTLYSKQALASSCTECGP